MSDAEIILRPCRRQPLLSPQSPSGSVRPRFRTSQLSSPSGSIRLRLVPSPSTTSSSLSPFPSSGSIRSAAAPPSSTRRLAEVAGGTVAECAAVCCCFPFALLHFLFLAVYKLPAGFCRKALRKRRRRKLIKKGLLPPKRRKCECGCDETELQIHPIRSIGDLLASAEKSPTLSFQSDKAVIDLEKEMWERFYNTGFWRSSSQRERI
ncbi:hypothetical protein RJ641_025250 [Dillenia turbinata]|uniref:Uncharacterized protein n=1 Tax=Dillenia turbinata TaxID=194707 RepID=A0AAN8ZRH8_9MAGN